MAVGLEVFLSNVVEFLLTIAPLVGLILMLLGMTIYALSYLQPPDNRGKWQGAGVNMFIGGVILTAIAGVSTYLQEMAGNLLRPA